MTSLEPAVLVGSAGSGPCAVRQLVHIPPPRVVPARRVSEEVCADVCGREAQAALSSDRPAAVCHSRCLSPRRP